MSPHSGRGKMHYVYRLQSAEDPEKTIIDTSSNVRARFKLHNSGEVPETAAHRPWVLSFYTAFPSRTRAKEFAHYLKSEAGQAFGAKHLWPSREAHS
ncbi:MAG: GIY-YIG nuclease family protein [Verrucomicrobia bacterium]|nr:GIY-YIG nuclease family protein [Verrucomicrobiota bacterium]MCH8525892.1 GIY-YIG nuclease family protein [Kiritimatiellia bacterium]